MDSTHFISLLLSAEPCASDLEPPAKPEGSFIEIRAPGDTIAVIADLRFGPRRLCRFDRLRGIWSCRFSVPPGARDVSCPVRIVCVRRGGLRTELKADCPVQTVGAAPAGTLWLIVTR